MSELREVCSLWWMDDSEGCVQLSTPLTDMARGYGSERRMRRWKSSLRLRWQRACPACGGERHDHLPPGAERTLKEAGVLACDGGVLVAFD